MQALAELQAGKHQRAESPRQQQNQIAQHSRPVTSFVIWEGTSPITKLDLVAVLTVRESDNEKTGNMLGVYIFPADVKRLAIPTGDIISRGLDAACCGDCVFRSKQAGGSGGCYTHGPTLYLGTISLFKALKETGWPALDLTGKDAGFIRRQCESGRKLRLGVYGDPGLLPLELVSAICAEAGLDDRGRANWTGYSHAWRQLDKRWQKFLMASTETEEGTDEAQEAGWRTFRVGQVGGRPEPGEFNCPASAEMGYRSSCEKCMACAGTSSLTAKNVVIAAHGSNSNILRAIGVVGGARPDFKAKLQGSTERPKADAKLRRLIGGRLVEVEELPYVAPRRRVKRVIPTRKAKVVSAAGGVAQASSKPAELRGALTDLASERFLGELQKCLSRCSVAPGWRIIRGRSGLQVWGVHEGRDAFNLDLRPGFLPDTLWFSARCRHGLAPSETRWGLAVAIHHSELEQSGDVLGECISAAFNSAPLGCDYLQVTPRLWERLPMMPRDGVMKRNEAKLINRARAFDVSLAYGSARGQVSLNSSFPNQIAQAECV
jgi:hypothetical protein